MATITDLNGNKITEVDLGSLLSSSEWDEDSNLVVLGIISLVV